MQTLRESISLQLLRTRKFYHRKKEGVCDVCSFRYRVSIILNSVKTRLRLDDVISFSQ